MLIIKVLMLWLLLHGFWGITQGQSQEGACSSQRYEILELVKERLLVTNRNRTLPESKVYSTREQPANANQIVYLPQECNYLSTFTFLSLRISHSLNLDIS